MVGARRARARSPPVASGYRRRTAACSPSRRATAASGDRAPARAGDARARRPSGRGLLVRGRGAEQVGVVGGQARRPASYSVAAPGEVVRRRSRVVSAQREPDPSATLGASASARSPPAGRLRPSAVGRRRCRRAGRVRQGEPGPRRAKVGVERDRPLVVATTARRSVTVVAASPCRDLPRPSGTRRRRPGSRSAARPAAPGAVAQRHAQRLGHPARDVGLHLEDVGQRRVERLLPAVVGAPPATSTSSGLTRTRLPPPLAFSQRTVPVSR